jgi:hypothetical protein
MLNTQNSGSRWLASLGVVTACLALAGCGDRLSTVSGAITLDGQPVMAKDGVMATIMFQPVTGGAAAVGRLDSEGRYHISTGAQTGLTPGDYVATCAINQLIPSTTGGAASAKALSDPKYADSKTSGFQFTVTPGDNEFDLALTSAAKTAAGRGG